MIKDPNNIYYKNRPSWRVEITRMVVSIIPSIYPVLFWELTEHFETIFTYFTNLVLNVEQMLRVFRYRNSEHIQKQSLSWPQRQQTTFVQKASWFYEIDQNYAVFCLKIHDTLHTKRSHQFISHCFFFSFHVTVYFPFIFFPVLIYWHLGLGCSFFFKSRTIIFVFHTF